MASGLPSASGADIADEFEFACKQSFSPDVVVTSVPWQNTPFSWTYQVVPPGSRISQAIYMTERLISPWIFGGKLDRPSVDALHNFWRNWLYMSSFTHYHGTRVIAMRTRPELPPSVEELLNDALKCPNWNLEFRNSEVETTRTRMAQAMRSITSLKLITLFEAMSGWESMRSTSWMKSNCADFLTFMKYVVHICLAVGELHQLGVVHNNLDDDVSFCASKGLVKIVDYSRAQLRGRNDTPSYSVGIGSNVPPERTDHPLDPAYMTFESDIYMLGITLDELYLTYRQTKDDDAPEESEIGFKENFIGAMRRINPGERPSIQQLLMEEPYTRYSRLNGRLTVEELKKAARKAYRAAAVRNGLSPEVSSDKRTVSEAIDRALNGDIRRTLTAPGADRTCTSNSDLDEEEAHVEPGGMLDRMLNCCCPCYPK